MRDVWVIEVHCRKTGRYRRKMAFFTKDLMKRIVRQYKHSPVSFVSHVWHFTGMLVDSYTVEEIIYGKDK